MPFSRRHTLSSWPSSSKARSPPSMGQAASDQDPTPNFIADPKGPLRGARTTYMSRDGGASAEAAEGLISLRNITATSPDALIAAVGGQHWQTEPVGD